MKLSDFGFANFVLEEEKNVYEQLSTTYCGTLPYYSPQLLQKRPYSPFKADVWAMGIVLFAMLTNRFAYHFQDTKKMLAEMLDWPAFIRTRFDGQSPLVKDLLQNIFLPDDRQRPTMKEVLEHRWILTKGK